MVTFWSFIVNRAIDSFTIQPLLVIAASAANKQEAPMLNLMQRFLKDQSGAAAIEYGLIASGISVVIIPAVNNVGNKLVATFQTLQNAL
jgi:pilus assembly protein Flp/PilA